MEPVEDNKSNQEDNYSGNMYSYHQEEQNPPIGEGGAIRRSLGEENPNLPEGRAIRRSLGEENPNVPEGGAIRRSLGEENPNVPEGGAIRRSLGEANPNAPSPYQYQNSSYNNDRAIGQNSIIIHVDQSPPLYWMFFLIFGIIQVVFIIFLANYYNWDEYNKPSFIENNEKAKTIINQKYKYFQDINIMIFLGFGFLRSFLKHHSWTSIALTLMGGVLSFEFGLFTLICWSSIMRKSWYPGKFNFQHLLDSNYCAAATVISLGALFGKLSFAQYFVMILAETIFSTLNYILLRQVLKIVDIGGAITVHLFGAVFGGIFSLVSFVHKNERERIRLSPHLGTNYNSNIFALFGTLILISYWPSFNTALVEGNQKYRGIINTYLSIGGSIIGTFIISPICNMRKFKINHILNSTFAGGIIVAGCCNIINEFYLCIVFGFSAGILSTILFFLLSDRLTQKGFHDTSGIIYYHGIPGFLGGIVSTIFVGNLFRFDNVDIKDVIGKILDYDLQSGERKFSIIAGIHFGSIFLTIFIAACSGLVAGFIIKFCNCNIAIRYFNDSEFFDSSDIEPFPWDDEEVELKVHYDSKA